MIYLDHAATSHPKPEPVLQAVVRWYRELGVSADRGDSRRCAEVAAGVRAARTGVGRLCGMPADRVAFTSGATEALNLFLRAFLRPGDRVLTTAFEHSSVARPLVALQRERGLQLEVLPPGADGGLGADTVRAALDAFRPRLLAFTHASNVTGLVLDAAALCELARARGCRTLLDASQTAGVLPLAVGADAVVASCHKSLLAPPGLGFLAAGAELALPAQKQGGTGSSRALTEHPAEWPTAFEAGTPNTPAILGLAAALRWLAETGPPRQAGLDLVDALAEDLRARGCRLLQPPPDAERLPILSFLHPSLDPAEVGLLLDSAGIHVRTGYHCAPWLHAHLGTASGGTVRVSPGPGITADDIRAVSAALGG